MELNLDNTKRSCFSSCPRKYYWQHIRNLRSPSGSTALRYGLTWHAALESYYLHIQQSSWSDAAVALSKAALAAKTTWDTETAVFPNFYSDYRTLENCLLAFTTYIDHYAQDKSYLKVVEIERIFKLPITIIDGTSINFTGKIDAIVSLNDSLWLMEHKTTSMSLSQQQARINRDPQVIGYSYAGTRLPNLPAPISGILISTHHLSAYKSRMTGLYNSPKIEFERRPQIFTDGDFSSWRTSFIWTAGQLLDCLDRNYFPMQLDSCYRYGKCSYTDLCEQGPDPSDANTSAYIEVSPWNVEETGDAQ
jgi:hypothetical protein